MVMQRSTQFFEPWHFVGVSGDPALAIPELNDRLRELAAKFAIVSQFLSFGPVPGAYQVFQFLIRDWDDASTSVAAGEVSPVIKLPVECVPIAFSVSTVIGSATVQLLTGATELLTADLDSAATPPYINRAQDFTKRRFEKDYALFMRVETPTSNPLAVLGTLFVNQMPKVQQP
jgi:hypothetical protein